MDMTRRAHQRCPCSIRLHGHGNPLVLIPSSAVDAVRCVAWMRVAHRTCRMTAPPVPYTAASPLDTKLCTKLEARLLLRPNAHRVSRRWQSIQPRRPMDTCMQQPLSSHPCDETSKQASKQTRLRVCSHRQLSRSQYGSSLLKSVTNVLLASKPGQPVLP